MDKKYFIYIAVVAVLLIAWYYRERIEDSVGHKVKNAKMASPFVDDRIEAQVKDAMDR